MSKDPITYVLSIPEQFRKADTCLGWFQNVTLHSGEVVCWSLDDVIVERGEVLENLEEDFEEFDTSKWLFAPGAKIKVRNEK